MRVLDLKMTDKDKKLSYRRVTARCVLSRDYFVDTSRLDVRNSQIENVSDEAWSSLRVVDRVDLSGNRVNTLPPLLLTENITFRGIFVHGNPLYCECDERWLAPWLTSLCSALHEPDSVKCHAPNWLSVRSIVSLRSDDFCRNPYTERFVFTFTVCRQR